MMDDNKYKTKPKRRIKWNYHDYNNMKTEQCVFIIVKFKLKKHQRHISKYIKALSLPNFLELRNSRLNSLQCKCLKEIDTGATSFYRTTT